MIEYGAYFGRQFVPSIRLLEQIKARIEAPLPHDSALGISRSEQNWKSWT
jgi:hypothetical protein